MKKYLLLVLLVSAVSTNAQTLKEALYSGKLKSDTGTVVRKDDDLSSKIDTSTKKPVEPEKPKTVTLSRDSSIAASIIQSDSAAIPGVIVPENNATKDNNKIWKEYIDELTGTLRTEVLPSKKIKSGTYSLLIEYEIGLDGEITVNYVSSSPENSFLEQQVKERITLTGPKMNILLSNYGKPRKAVKKYTLILSK